MSAALRHDLQSTNVAASNCGARRRAAQKNMQGQCACQNMLSGKPIVQGNADKHGLQTGSVQTACVGEMPNKHAWVQVTEAC